MLSRGEEGAQCHGELRTMINLLVVVSTGEKKNLFITKYYY
jgi:hypothetical protein